MKPKILTTLPTYTGRLFLSDLIAGGTVAMVALPLSIAIAIASGATPAVGLVTAVVAGFIISLLGGSRVQIGGPTGAFIVVVFAIIAEHGYDGLVLATLMAGVILLIAGFLRAGSLVAHVPEAVIDGFTVGIAVIIAASQLKDFFGLDVSSLPADFVPKMAALFAARETASLAAAGVGVATAILIVVIRRIAPAFPGAIVAVALTSGAAAFFNLDVATIASSFGELPSSLPMPQLPSISVDRLVELLPSALVIAFLAGVESLLSAMVADRMIEDHHRPNAEVIAQGAANIGSALFGGLPATGAIARTATNIRAGGKTPVAGIVHAVAVLAAMMLFAPLVGQLALPALAALLIVTAWNMSEPHRWGARFAARPSDRYLIAQTLLLTVFADLSIAIGAGVAIGLALRLKQRNAPPADWTPPDR
ncbi:SulP family inorganic anion transporter [Fulvimarina sp. MAC8]|uniref:SulP family inorganic anion transporter n=1 Tax=Fulvimarina sp. MAC8 TaxID=3162874 RepID=UPI0032EEC109